MKYVRQFWIILLISAMGEALHVLIPLPVPATGDHADRTGDHADRTGNHTLSGWNRSKKQLNFS